MIKYLLTNVLIIIFFTACAEVSHISYDIKKERTEDDIKQMNFFFFTNFLAYNAKFSKHDKKLIIQLIKKHYNELDSKPTNNQLVFLSQVIKYFSYYSGYSPINEEESKFVDKCYEQYLSLLEEQYYEDRRDTFIEQSYILTPYINYLSSARQYTKSKVLIDKFEQRYLSKKHTLSKLQEAYFRSNIMSFNGGFYTLSGEQELAISYHQKNLRLINNYFSTLNSYDSKKHMNLLNSYLYSSCELALLYSQSEEYYPKLFKLHQEPFLNEILNGKFSKGFIGQSTLTINFPIAFAKMGDTKNALRSLSIVESNIQNVTSSKDNILPIKLNFLQNKALIYYYLKDYENALKLYNQANSFAQENGFTLFYYSYGNIAQLHSKNKNYNLARSFFEKAIKRYEHMRSGFAINARGKFFETDAKYLYQNYINFLSEKYFRNKNNENFYDLLTAVELFKNRQLGDFNSLLNKKQDLIVLFKNHQKKLKSDEIIIEYLLLDKKILLLTILNQKVEVFKINKPQNFDNSILSIKQDLSNPQSNLKNLNKKIQNLSTLLLGPIKKQLSVSKTIFLSSDSVLNIIPFDIMSNSSSYLPLVLSKNIINLPSLKHLFIKEKPYKNNNILVLANPAYKLSNIPIDMTKTRNSTYLNYFTPLEETAIEADTIEKLFGANLTDIYQRNQASETNIKNIALDSYKYLHFATHGILGGDVPTISEPALVLAAEKSKNEDGFLTSSEIEQLKLNAKLTVLSACNTGSGEILKGEGVLGLSRSFLIAGSESVIVSLWEVPSLETVELMNSFYLELSQNDNISKALRSAKVTFLNQGKKNQDYETKRGLKVKQTHQKNNKQINLTHPYYWSAFITIGQNR